MPADNNHPSEETLPKRRRHHGPVDTRREAMELPLVPLAAAMSAGGVEQMVDESRTAGQRQLAAGGDRYVRLPTRSLNYDRDAHETLKEWGVEFPEDDGRDPLFRNAILPEGWKIVSEDHPMWSRLVDSLGRTRAGICYKADFWDRDAHINVDRRFVAGCEFGEPPAGCDKKLLTPYISDGGVRIWEGQLQVFERDDYEAQEKTVAVARALLDQIYPAHDDYLKAWADADAPPRPIR